MPLKVTKKPTRRDLLKVVTELQTLISKGRSLHANDRNPNGFEQGRGKTYFRKHSIFALRPGRLTRQLTSRQ